MIATTPSTRPPTTENSAMIATINAAMPSPFFGPTGGGVNPAYGAGGGGG